MVLVTHHPHAPLKVTCACHPESSIPLAIKFHAPTTYMDADDNAMLLVRNKELFGLFFSITLELEGCDHLVSRDWV